MPETPHVALLRAVNVAGHNPLPMAALRDLLASLGLEDVRTLLQSGNAVFRAPRTEGAALEARLKSETARRLGLDVDYLVRDAAEWADLIAANPFPEEARRDPGHLLVHFLSNAPDPGAVDALRASIRGKERVEARGRHLFAVYPDGIGRSKLTPALVESRLSRRATGRNWNTVTKLAALLDSPG